MAHDLTIRPVVRVQQVLHGYARGHQRLAGTSELRPRDAKTMLVLSDISGPGIKPDDSGYLTGYPLPESGFYVLARTWAAPEMPRPGCVWTHSLLIDFTDLATLSDPTALLSLFRRPEIGDISSYGSTLSLQSERSAIELPTGAVDFARRVAWGLYDQPKRRVVAARPRDADPDEVVIALWGQQWPRLRRSFRFCTLVGVDRAPDGSFDLQFVGEERGGRLRFADALDLGVNAPGQATWLDDALEDLLEPDVRGLRSFMRRTGSDFESGRAAFASLCRLHALTTSFERDPHAVSKAVRLFDEELKSHSARTARAVITTEALKLTSLDDVALEFVLANLDLVNEAELSENGGRLGAEVWRRNPARVAALLTGSSREQQVAEQAFDALTTQELVVGIEHSPDLAFTIVEIKPEILTERNFWTALSAAPDAAFAKISQHPQIAEAAVEAMIEANRDDLAKRAISALGSGAILRMLAAKWSANGGSNATEWLRMASRDTVAVAEFLGRASSVSQGMLVALARATSPDVVPNDFGHDPWYEALSRSSAPVTDTYLASYLLNRALGWRSRSSAELVRSSFDTAYSALTAGRLSEDAWRLLDDRLPWVFPLIAWDHCLRVRSSIAALFVDRNLSPATFVKISENDAYFADLVVEVVRTYRGKEYLNAVRFELEKESEKYASRKRLVDSLAFRR